MEGRQRDPQDPRPARPARCPARRSASRSSSATRRPSTSRPREPLTPERAPPAVRGRPLGVVVQDDPATHAYPLAVRGRRPRRDLRRTGPPGPIDPRRPRPGLLGRLGQPAQGGRDERGRTRRDPRRPRLDRARLGPRRPAVSSGRERGRGRRRDGVTHAERQAALEAITAEVRDCTRCRLHATRTRAVPGEGDALDRGGVRRGGTGLQRGPAGSAVRRPRRRSARAPARLDRLAAPGRVHHERREMPAAREPRPGARRDRRLCAVPGPPSSRSSVRRW